MQRWMAVNITMVAAPAVRSSTKASICLQVEAWRSPIQYDLGPVHVLRCLDKFLIHWILR